MLNYRLLSRICAIALAGICSFYSTRFAYAEPRTWVVRPGDALSVLARRFKIDIDKLRQWNELENDSLHVGQELVLEPNTEAKATMGEVYRVAKGDTLRRIAKSYHVTLDELKEWNPSVDPDKLVEGQELRVGEASRRIDYKIQEGDTLSSIAALNKVKVRDIKRWNPEIKPDKIRADQHLVIFSKLPPSYSESIGAPNHGQLVNAIRLPNNPGFSIRDRDRTWGTDETIANIVSAVDRVRKSDPKAPQIDVHDISLKTGGTMFGHNSHQSGRDVDIAYYQTDCPDRSCPFKPISASVLDVKRQWTLLKYWLTRKQVEAVFIDYQLQKALYRYARDQGATRDELLMWFQYPRGETFPLGVIRHYPKHDDHIHVRFACDKTDPQCQTFRPLLMQFEKSSVADP
jgi:LysM repeat protein